MQYVSSSEARNHLAAMLDNAAFEPVIIQKHGNNAAVLLSYDDYQKLTHSAAHDFQVICDQIAKNAQARGLTDAKFAEIMAEEDE